MSLIRYNDTSSPEYPVRQVLGMLNSYRDEPSSGIHGSGSWGGCCGMMLGFVNSPSGMCVAVASEKVEVYEKRKHPKMPNYYTISQEVVDIGNDHFLNLRYIQLLKKGYVYDIEREYPPSTKRMPCLPNVPEVYSCGYGEFVRQMNGTRGLIKSARFGEEYVYQPNEEVWAILRSWKDMYLSFAYSDDEEWQPGRKKLFDDLIKPAGWEEKIVYHSPKFHNLLHASDVDRDYLRFVLIKL